MQVRCNCFLTSIRVLKCVIPCGTGVSEFRECLGARDSDVILKGKESSTQEGRAVAACVQHKIWAWHCSGRRQMLHCWGLYSGLR